MKKLLLFAAAAMTFAACSTDTTEDIAVLPDGTLRVSFSDDDSRVQLDENSRTVWNEGDQISVFNKTDGNECWRFDGKTGDTVGTISRVSGSSGSSAIGKIFAVYPYAESNTVSADGTITTEIPATQKYCADSYGVGNNIMVASSESGDLAFKNALGWIKIRLSGTETVKSLVLEGNDGETLTGTATIDADLTVSLAADAAKSLTLDCGEGVALSSDPTAFYFAVVPQVFEKGITVTAHYSDGSTFEKPTDKAITVERNHIVPMTKFDATVIPNNQIWYTSTDEKIVVPYATDGFGANIISNTYENGKGVITFDEEITAIGHSAFYYCSSLTSIIIPDSVTSIGNYAFSGCSSLTSVTIPDSVTTFLDYAFYRCNNLTAFYGYCASADNRCLVQNGKLIAFAPYGLTEYVIPDNVTSIGNGAFSGCSSLTSVTIPNRVSSIGELAFYYCSSLTSVNIPDGVTSIGDSTFYYCSSLTSVNIPDGVTSIGNSAFYNCSSLTRITIPDSVTSIGNSAFRYCSSLTAFYGKYASTDSRCLVQDGKFIAFAPSGLTDYVIPDNVTSIGIAAFSGCGSLTSVTIPNRVSSIGELAFYYCSSLTSINIPDGVTSIGYSTFSGCSSLTSVTIPDGVTSIGESVFSGCRSLTSVTIPDSVTSIGQGTFSNCISLISIYIPDGVTSIGELAFYGCIKLTSIYCKPTIPPTLGDSAFYNISLSAKIYVSTASVDAYKSASGWSSYASMIEGYDF